jgi:hypothetical protein
MKNVAIARTNAAREREERVTTTETAPGAALTLALAKCIKEAVAKAARPQLTAGAHTIDARVRINGTLMVNPDTPAGPPVSSQESQAFDPRKLLALALLDNQRDTPHEIQRLAVKAAKADPSPVDVERILQAFSAHAELLLPKIMRTTQTSARLGSVSFNGAVTELHDERLAKPLNLLSQ